MKFRVLTLFCATLLLFVFSSCNKDSYITSPVNPSSNLVIVTDNDPGSYVMVKIIGQVRSTYPDIHITYLQSKQFDIYEGAFLLNTALESFPEGTVIAGIIDPGTDSKRLVLQAGSRRVFAPDNTLATWILHYNPSTTCFYVENPSVLGGSNASDLPFEDFYSRAICSLISEAPGKAFGPVCSSPALFPIQEPVQNGNLISGQILFTDNFGNCITNIHENTISNFAAGTVFTLKSDTSRAKIKLGTSYSSVAKDENVCFINSSKFLELAINLGSFSEKYNLKSGAMIQLAK